MSAGDPLTLSREELYELRCRLPGISAIRRSALRVVVQPVP